MDEAYPPAHAVFIGVSGRLLLSLSGRRGRDDDDARSNSNADANYRAREPSHYGGHDCRLAYCARPGLNYGRGDRDHSCCFPGVCRPLSRVARP